MASRSSKVYNLITTPHGRVDIVQLDTLIVWTEPTTSIDMALSFEASEGCATIWSVVIRVGQSQNKTDMLFLQEIHKQYPTAAIVATRSRYAVASL